MRGKVVNNGVILDDTRITPAYAGKSEIIASAKFHGLDHPRLCGEKFSRLFLASFRKGSPPPMRGKADMLLQ